MQFSKKGRLIQRLEKAGIEYSLDGQYNVWIIEKDAMTAAVCCS